MAIGDTIGSTGMARRAVSRARSWPRRRGLKIRNKLELCRRDSGTSPFNLSVSVSAACCPLVVHSRFVRVTWRAAKGGASFIRRRFLLCCSQEPHMRWTHEKVHTLRPTETRLDVPAIVEAHGHLGLNGPARDRLVSILLVMKSHVRFESLGDTVLTHVTYNYHCDAG
jgi:hypothetical protein